ncbi:MAG: ketoacyl-ACP synthase III [Chloroflexi bacterium]|nr:ketoacyl-ACP synthase III [Chloroflexota bacterium]MCC6896556.1 ketoacyl-ACP synthase III [Anaerolineae bacterium]
MTMPRAEITGWGKYVPGKVLTNDDLSKMVDTNDEWITARTGIKKRHIRTEADTTTSMACAAAHEALAVAGLTPADLDLIVVANSSPDYLLPAPANLIQHQLGAKCPALTLAAGCSGWVYSLVTASQFIQTGAYKNIIVIGVELISYAIDYTDRSTCVLFGDGAAAVILQPSQTEAGVMTFELGSDGEHAQHLMVPGGGTRKPLSQEVVDNREMYIRMNGQEVFKFATRKLISCLHNITGSAGMSPADLDLIIPHQANLRIIEYAADKLQLPMSKFFINLHKYGNTSTASIPLALVEAIEEGRLKPGDVTGMVAFGSGLSWAGAVIRMGEALAKAQPQAEVEGALV